MLKLIEINKENIEEEYQAIKSIPYNEFGFLNKYYNCNKEEFEKVIVPTLINYSKGIGLKDGRVPQTYYFLYDDNKIVGLFKIRHELNEHLKKGAGHIGYTIIKEYRGKCYATKGLALAIEICKTLIKEDEIYMSVYKNNLASLKVQLKNGASIVDKNAEEYFTRIKL